LFKRTKEIIPETEAIISEKNHEALINTGPTIVSQKPQKKTFKKEVESKRPRNNKKEMRQKQFIFDPWKKSEKNSTFITDVGQQKNPLTQKLDFSFLQM
jgi:hypothetical protein